MLLILPPNNQTVSYFSFNHESVLLRHIAEMHLSIGLVAVQLLSVGKIGGLCVFSLNLFFLRGQFQLSLIPFMGTNEKVLFDSD